MANGNGSIDFSSVGGQPVSPAPSAPATMDFSSVGGKQVSGATAPPPPQQQGPGETTYVPMVGAGGFPVLVPMQVPKGQAQQYQQQFRQGQLAGVQAGLTGIGAAV